MAITCATKIGAEPGAVRSRPIGMISRRVLLALLALTPLATATGCGSPSASGATFASADLPRSEADPEAGADAVRAVTQFTSDLYRDVAQTVQGNLVCSPLSAAIALAMTVQGARGATADELLLALHADSADRLAAGMNALDGALASRAGTFERPGDEPGKIALAVANSLWGQTGLAWEQAFLDVLARDFGTGMRQVDYRADPDRARSAINAWVSERTNGRIPELVPDGAVHELTRLALVNAVYLKAPWSTPFETSSTVVGPFTRLDSSQVQTDLMHGSFPAEYAAGPGWSAATLPYADGRLAMTVVVPEAGQFADVERGLDADWIEALFAAMEPVVATEPGEVAVTLPKWTTRSQIDLEPALQRLGVELAFTDLADLSGMTTQEPLMIDRVCHEGFIAVDEAGTEAAAATAVMAQAVSAPAVVAELRADRPFLYLIHDNLVADPLGNRRTPLFIGRVVDPTA